jgi:hypothetical protein
MNDEDKNKVYLYRWYTMSDVYRDVNRKNTSVMPVTGGMWLRFTKTNGQDGDDSVTSVFIPCHLRLGNGVIGVTDHDGETLISVEAQ